MLSTSKFLCCSMFLVCFFVGAIQASSEEEATEMKNAANKCIEETLIDMNTMARVRSGMNDVEDPTLNKFGYCMLNNMELLLDDGKFNMEKVMEATDEAGKEEMQTVLDKCLSGLEPITEDNAWELFKCYRTEKPNEVMF